MTPPSPSRLHLIGRLLEHDAPALERRVGKARGFAVHHQITFEPGLLLADLLADEPERFARQHIAALRRLVAENAVIKQRIGVLAVKAEQGTLALSVPRPASLAEPDMRREQWKADACANTAF